MKFLIPFLVIAALQTGLAQTPKDTPMNDKKTQSVTLGGGCFWCMEALYSAVNGVTVATPGYAGGKIPNPTYEMVCTGRTGHAEVVHVEFDPSVISYDEILNLFWKAHDPTTLNQQGADHGTQYRSIIITTNDTEKAIAEKSKAAAQKDFKQPIVTEITVDKPFYPAEKYHVDYYKNHPEEGYSSYVIEPKLEKFKKELKERKELK
ncbi:MAG: peptide-methionine (S)-S-oxide reductase MsrA [Chthoniobacterales bacterium]